MQHRGQDVALSVDSNAQWIGNRSIDAQSNARIHTAEEVALKQSRATLDVEFPPNKSALLVRLTGAGDFTTHSRVPPIYTPTALQITASEKRRTSLSVEAHLSQVKDLANPDREVLHRHTLWLECGRNPMHRIFLTTDQADDVVPMPAR